LLLTPLLFHLLLKLFVEVLIEDVVLTALDLLLNLFDLPHGESGVVRLVLSLEESNSDQSLVWQELHSFSGAPAAFSFQDRGDLGLRPFCLRLKA
jgi:hypothetical protein